MRLPLLPLAAVFLAVVRAPAPAEDAAPAPGPAPGNSGLTDHMSIPEVEKALQLYPPSADPGAIQARAEIARSMDRLVAFAVKADITDEQVAQLQPLRDFYLRQVDRGLDLLEKAPVTDGVLVVHFYSSSMVVKGPHGAIALDFQQGPRLTDTRNPERPDPVVARTGWSWTPRQLDRLAALLSASFITHCHGDHADYALTQRLLALGKPVVMTRQLKDYWPTLSPEHIVVPASGTVQKVAGIVDMDTFDGSQYMENDLVTKDAAGQETAYPTTHPDTVPDAETIFYLLHFGGFVFAQAAENNVPAGDWLRDAIAKGFRPDVYFSLGQRQGGRSVEEVLRAMGPTFHFPLHEYEMGHPHGGNRTAGLYNAGPAQRIAEGRAMPLFWGEGYALKPAMLPWHKDYLGTGAVPPPLRAPAPPAPPAAP